MESKESYKPVELKVFTFSSLDVIVTSDRDENELEKEAL